jgi:uncharacterized RmlC-like cupin family protein
MPWTALGGLAARPGALIGSGHHERERESEVHPMERSRPVVVRPEQEGSESLLGSQRRHFNDQDGHWVGWAGWISNDAGDVGGWHHHADNETYVHVIRGSITIEFGPGGRENVVARAGDLFVVPSRTVHRELTSDDTDLEAFIIRVGGEPEKVDVEGPDSAGS